jgi:hypothetical protein
MVRSLLNLDFVYARLRDSAGSRLSAESKVSGSDLTISLLEL